ncbi:MAG TPA: YihY/virulence factor BrkB family protein [Candidatus Ornithospirochaeta avicola]|uniref:YihY/virulence factor BrkB family protein n=1 Tax=Candidatus Ornithospirochaeta avicola TaxID=2840896 RepID=A0A9D1PSF8_9SPIO|nr:YihY/virulence factor BrkB family protein [Candidatus Ornithospirochaeta avicola]
MNNNKEKGILAKAQAWWSDYFHVLALAFRRMGRDNINIMASGMVYSTLIALVPTVTFLFFILSAFGALDSFIAFLIHFLSDNLMVENAEDLVAALKSYTGNAMSLGIVGFVTFAITSILLVNKAYTVINRIFRTSPRTSTLRRFTTFLTFLVVLAFLILLLVAIQSKIAGSVRSAIGYAERSKTIWENLVLVGSIWGILFSLIKFLPNAKIRKTSASIGATSGMVAIIISSAVFTFFINTSVNYSIIYGSLASILFALLYFYILWYLIMMSAEIAYVHQFRPDKGLIKGHPESPLSQITEGINLVLLVSDRYKSGGGAMNERELVRKLAVPQSRLYGYINCLEDGGIIMSVNNNHTAFIPSRPLDRIYLKEIIQVLYGLENKMNEDISTVGEAIAIELASRGVKDMENLNVENLLERV